jgi:hypothetical protein
MRHQPRRGYVLPVEDLPAGAAGLAVWRRPASRAATVQRPSPASTPGPSDRAGEVARLPG